MNAKLELLDVVDEKDRITGKILDRETIHENGLWHRQATCWIMNKEGKLLFQKRSKLKSHNPSKWSRTGGHIDAGEEVLDGIIREIKEEEIKLLDRFLYLAIYVHKGEVPPPFEIIYKPELQVYKSMREDSRL